ncbi:transglycosylase domain-containing protein [Actinomadura rudentiformis]|uniref:Penicillin-binding protein n=1 Tax=Actinomadura rudentiformis TaxID=359158 RepID=A0A6H9YSZ5_9ACTN|nr:transglycosylase domain-containing protein [Actinomadura rudentiformis]KAB2347280.1 penicillin-binding protein [Actinomadura rudentiformis]
MSSSGTGPEGDKPTGQDDAKPDESKGSDKDVTTSAAEPATTKTATMTTVEDVEPTPDEAPTGNEPPDDAPASDAPANEAPANEAPGNGAPADEAPGDNAPASDTSVNDADASQALAGDASASDASGNGAAASEAPGDNAPASDPFMNDAAASETFSGDAPASDASGNGAPAGNAPASDPFMNDAAASEAPGDNAPASDPFVNDVPASGAFASDAPVNGAAADEAAVSGAAVSEAAARETVAGKGAGDDAAAGGMVAPGTAASKVGAGKVSPGKGGKKQRSRPVRYARRAAFTVLGLIGFGIAAFAIAYVLTPVPSPQESAVAQGPSFYYSDGKTLIAKTGTNRDAVDLDKVPKGVREAVIAAENRGFYDDPGVSVKGTARAFWSTVSGEQLQGGSTITQQMVRNYYGGIGTERSVFRKLKEIMVSLKVGREKDKDWILEQYLNTIYFGRDAYGIQAAAKAYYGKDVSQLTAAEGAYLAAAIQQPTPFGSPTAARRPAAEQRWRAVLNNMVRDNAVTAAEVAQMTFPQPKKQKITDILKGQKGYMVNVAKKELLERRGYTEDQINRGGLKITTTFDEDLMDAAKDAVTSNVPDGMSKKIRTAMVSVDPKNGQVEAFYGGRDYLDEAGSSAFWDLAQAGSGFKPIALAAALDDGKTLSTSYDGSSPQYFNRTALRNDGNAQYGMVNLVTMTQNSINTAYVNLGQDIGTERIAEMAEKMGIPASQMTKAQRDAPSFPLGTVSVHPVQQAAVYATFASEGVYRKPYTVKSVSDESGEEKDFTEKGKRAFSQQVAKDATYAMSKVVQSGTGTGAQLSDGRDVAGKTGTTNGGRAIWFNGFIPQMATSVAMFRSDGKPLSIPGYGVYGGQLPAQMWNSYMSKAVAIKNFEIKEFGDPSSYPGSYGGTPSGRSTGAPSTPSDRPSRPPLTPNPGDGSRPPKPPSGRPTPPIPEPSLPGPGDPEPGDPGDGGGNPQRPNG